MRQRGPTDAVSAVMGEAAAALRRRRIARRPRVKLYDDTGWVTVLDPDSERAQAMLDTAVEMVEVVTPSPGGRR